MIVITQLSVQRLLGFLNLQTDPRRFYKNAGLALFKIFFVCANFEPN